MTEIRIKGSLQGKQPVNPWDEGDLRKQAARLWHNTGTLLIKPEWLNDLWDKQHTINVAEKMFGKRG